MQTISRLMIGGALLALATPVYAQTADEPLADTQGENTDEIVVTAQRRTERVQDVPISLSVVGGEQLARQQVTQLNDLTKSTASLQINSAGGGGGGGSAFIRGIGTAALSRSAESAVGIVVDGVVQGNTNIANLFDVARVEVLRGPQGTLFGQSVSAGVINISTVAPDPTAVSGKMTLQLAGDGLLGSEFGRQVIQGAVNVPVSETSAVRFSAQGSRINGILTNTYKNLKDELTDVSWRARYKGQFGAVTANLIADYAYSKGTDGQFFTLTTVTGPQNAQLATLCGIVARPGNLNHCAGAFELQTKRAYGASGQFDIDLGPIVLTSITSRRAQDLYVTGDIDRMPNPLVLLNVNSGVKTNYDLFTQEVRVSINADEPLSLTIGGFYYNADTVAFQGPSQGGFTIIPTGARVGNEEFSQQETENLSGFGEARFKAGPLTVFAGGRITRATLTQQGTRQQTLPAPGGILRSDLRFEDTDFSWRAGAQFAPSRDFQIYGSAARGYKNAQISAIAIIGGTTFLGRIIEPEKPMAYELGFKSTLLDGRASFNLAAYHQTVRNFQTQSGFRDPLTQFVSLLPINISKVVSKGIEMDAFGRVSDQFTLNLSAAYNDAKYPADYRARNGDIIGASQVAFAPKFAAALSGEFIQPLGGDVEGFVSFDVNYRSRVRLTDEIPSEAISYDKAHWTFGGRIGARIDDGWSVSVYAANIGASRLAGAIAGLAGQPGSTVWGTAYGPQSLRQVGLQLEAGF